MSTRPGAKFGTSITSLPVRGTGKRLGASRTRSSFIESEKRTLLLVRSFRASQQPCAYLERAHQRHARVRRRPQRSPKLHLQGRDSQSCARFDTGRRSQATKCLRKEAEGRKRYYSQEEYQRLLHAVRRRFPEHSAELIVSVHSGMRLSEQYKCAWSQVRLNKREISLTKTKNGSPRTVQLNADAAAAIRSLQRPDQHSMDPVFPREGQTF